MNPKEPAFPGETNRFDSCGDRFTTKHKGISLRAYFAVKAMAGLVSCPTANCTYEELARHSVKYADALIAELSKQNNDS